MKTLLLYAAEQYSFVKDSRTQLLSYCKTVKDVDFLKENTSFGRGGSMRNLMVHIANVYEYWIAEIALDRKINYTSYEACKTVEEVERLFDSIDKYVEALIQKLEDPSTTRVYLINNEKKETSLFKIFSHVISHEFHHKGQILSISRLLGYTPVDTDMIR